MTDINGTSHSAYSVFMGVIVVLFLVIFGVLSNSLAIHFFLNKMASRVFSRIFSAIALTDVLTGLLTLFVGICYLADRQALFFDWPVFREVWGSLWNFTCRNSVYLVALLSITRAIRIFLPFSIVSLNTVCLAITVYALVLVGTTPAFYDIPHYYKWEWCALALNKSQFVTVHDLRYYMIVMSIPTTLFIPLPLTLISAGLTFTKIRRHVSLLRKNSCSGGNVNECPMNVVHQSGITVVLFVAVYVILNVPYCIIYAYVQAVSDIKSIPPPRVIPNPIFKTYVTGITHVLTISLNAALNPVLYYWRMLEFREYVNKVVFRRIKRTLGLENTSPVNIVMNNMSS